MLQSRHFQGGVGANFFLSAGAESWSRLFLRRLRDQLHLFGKQKSSVAEPDRLESGDATFRVEPEPISYLAGAGAASFRQAKKKSLVLLQNMT